MKYNYIQSKPKRLTQEKLVDMEGMLASGDHCLGLSECRGCFAGSTSCLSDLMQYLIHTSLIRHLSNLSLSISVVENVLRFLPLWPPRLAEVHCVTVSSACTWTLSSRPRRSCRWRLRTMPSSALLQGKAWKHDLVLWKWIPQRGPKSREKISNKNIHPCRTQTVVRLRACLWLY